MFEGNKLANKNKPGLYEVNQLYVKPKFQKLSIIRFPVKTVCLP